jgi:hypothetical protein
MQLILYQKTFDTINERLTSMLISGDNVRILRKDNSKAPEVRYLLAQIVYDKTSIAHSFRCQSMWLY